MNSKIKSCYVNNKSIIIATSKPGGKDIVNGVAVWVVLPWNNEHECLVGFCLFDQFWVFGTRSAARWNPESCWWDSDAAVSPPSRRWCSTRCPRTRPCSWRAPTRSAEKTSPTAPSSASRSGISPDRSISLIQPSITRWFSEEPGRSYSSSTHR